jgi:hypothetical protein
MIGDLANRTAGHIQRRLWERGRRRTRQDQISREALGPGEIADQDPHRTKKTCFFCRTGFTKSELFENTIQPFDLMSRRHPLSSTRATD